MYVHRTPRSLQPTLQTIPSRIPNTGVVVAVEVVKSIVKSIFRTAHLFRQLVRRIRRSPRRDLPGNDTVVTRQICFYFLKLYCRALSLTPMLRKGRN
jgi:hypothetical protein